MDVLCCHSPLIWDRVEKQLGLLPADSEDMLGDLVAGYGSDSDSEEDAEQGAEATEAPAQPKADPPRDSAADAAGAPGAAFSHTSSRAAVRHMCTMQHHSENGADGRVCLVRAVQAPPPKRKLPSASAMMAATSSWARPGNDPPPVQVDEAGTRYHNVAPPVGIRAEDGVMGGGGDYIKPVFGGGVSLDSSKVGCVLCQVNAGWRRDAAGPSASGSTRCCPECFPGVLPRALREHSGECCHVLRCLFPWQAFTGTRTLAGGPPAVPTVTPLATAPAKTKSSGPLVPPQLRGRKNVCTEDVHDTAASKKKKTK